MGWSIGYDATWKRDIGYGVPAVCDYPGCGEPIDRGLAHVCCNQEMRGGEHGCGLFFCEKHHNHYRRAIDHRRAIYGLCERCAKNLEPFTPTPDVPEWIDWKLTHDSWAAWREENPDEVERLRAARAADGADEVQG